MSSSKFGTPLSIIKNLDTHLLMVSDNKEGDYTLHSCVKSYDVQDKDKCDEVHYDQSVSKISIAKQSKNWFLVATGDSVQLFSIDNKTGKLTKMHTFKADFHPEDARVNTAEFIYGNEYVITGGNDTAIRVWKLQIDKDNDVVRGAKEYRKYDSHQNPITHLDVTFDHELVSSISSGDEKSCLIHDFQSGKLLNELTFSEKHGAENLSIKGCYFSLHRKYLYTLASDPGKNSYVTRWDAKSTEFKNLNTIKVANDHCENFSLSTDGFYIAIGSESGFIKSLNTRYIEIDRDDQHHPGKMACVDFSADTRFILTCDKEGTYCFVPNMRAPGIMRSVFQYLMIVMFSFYIYRLIMEKWFE